jgi:group I intron endonuclease
MPGLVYLITNIVTGKFYVGQTRQNLPRRKGEHVYRSNLGERDHKLYRSMRKHGLENFTFEVLYECQPGDDLDTMERFFIASANSYNRGYNMTCGGDGVSAETRAKLSAKFKGRKVTWLDKVWASRRLNPNAKHSAAHVLSGAANSRAKEYLVRLPDGTEQKSRG